MIKKFYDIKLYLSNAFRHKYIVYCFLLIACLFSLGTDAQTYRSSSQGTAADGVKALDVPKPASLQVGDVMIAAISVRPWDVNITVIPPGWVLVRSTLVGSTGTDGDNKQSIYYKIVTATDILPTTTTYQWKFNHSEGSAGGILAFSGLKIRIVLSINMQVRRRDQV